MKGLKLEWTMRTILLLLLVLLSSSCANNNKQAQSTPPPVGDEVMSDLSGTIVMMTNRIDLIENGTFQGYADQFKQRYPEANVEFEGLSNYATDILVRLSTKDAGDVLLLPVNLPAKELDYFSNRWMKKPLLVSVSLLLLRITGNVMGCPLGLLRLGLSIIKGHSKKQG